MKKLIVSILIGLLLGVVNAKYILVGRSLSLIPWAIAGLLIGYWSLKVKEALINGSIYGFMLSFAFMFSGYSGAAPAVTRIPFFAILGLFGAVCGLVLSSIGVFIRRKLKK